MFNISRYLFEYRDAPRAWGVYFQDSASPQMEALVKLHDNIMFYLVIILFGVGWILLSVIRNYVNTKSPISNKYLNYGTLISLVGIFVLVVFIIQTRSILSWDLYSIVDLKYLICMIDDPNTIKGTVEVNNVKISNLDVAIEKLRDGAIYIGGMSAAAKIMKGSSLPVRAKLGSVVGMGAASLISYKMVQNNLRQSKVEGGLSVGADKINTTVSASKSNVNHTCVNKLVGGGDDTGNFSISSLDIEQLQLDLYLHMIILYLFILVFMIFLMKSLSQHNLVFKSLQRLPFGSYIQTLLIKILTWWNKTSNVWIYLLLITIFFSVLVSAWSIYIILGNIK